MALPNNSVFISYRKDDSAGWATQLARELRSRLGESAVFIDDTTGIPYGSQWPDRIAIALDQCRIFLPVIAPSWQSEENIKRLNHPDDWVRRELLTANGRRVLSIPVFVNEAAVLKSDQFEPEFQTVINDLMTDQGIKLDRSIEHWPAKIDHLITRIETHLGIESTEGNDDADDDIVTHNRSSRSPSNLMIISTMAGVVAAIAGVIALYPVFNKSPTENSGNTTHIEGDVQGDSVAGNKIVNNRDPQDVNTIRFLQEENEKKQARIDELVSRLPEAANEQIREAIADAAISLSETDSDPSDVERAEQALDEGNTQLAKALYLADAEKKQAEGQAHLQASASSYRRLGALAFLDDTTAALEAYEKAVDLWPDDIVAWNQLGHLYHRIGKLEDAIDVYERVGTLAKSTDNQLIWSAISHGNLGIVYQKKGDLDRAIELYEQSLAIEKELGRKEGMASDYGNLGIVYQTKGDLDRARAAWEKALVLFDGLGSPNADKVRSFLSELSTDVE